jgi:hypothetical protein
MKWYYWVIIAAVGAIIIYIMFGRKSSLNTATGSQGDPITNSGTMASNQNPSAYDWFAGVIAPTLAAGLAVLPSLVKPKETPTVTDPRGPGPWAP